MKPEVANKWFRILFTLNALGLMCAAFAIFLPDNTMALAHQRLRLGDFPGMPIVEYLARSCSVLYAMHGVILFAVARDLGKYRDLVPLLIGLHLALGCLMLGIDLNSGMPSYWTFAEGPGIIAFALVLWFFWRQTGYRNDTSPMSSGESVHP